MSQGRPVWVMRDENGNITCVGSSSGGIPPQVPVEDRFLDTDQEILDFYQALQDEQNP